MISFIIIKIGLIDSWSLPFSEHTETSWNTSIVNYFNLKLAHAHENVHTSTHSDITVENPSKFVQLLIVVLGTFVYSTVVQGRNLVRDRYFLLLLLFSLLPFGKQCTSR